jgi:prepilin-type N-terminal cleavage/methylation domain-containing protein
MRFRAMRATNVGEAGFTLLEILVALVVFGFLLIGLPQSSRSKEI